MLTTRLFLTDLHTSLWSACEPWTELRVNPNAVQEIPYITSHHRRMWEECSLGIGVNIYITDMHLHGIQSSRRYHSPKLSKAASECGLLLQPCMSGRAQTSTAAVTRCRQCLRSTCNGWPSARVVLLRSSPDVPDHVRLYPAATSTKMNTCNTSCLNSYSGA